MSQSKRFSAARPAAIALCLLANGCGAAPRSPAASARPPNRIDVLLYEASHPCADPTKNPAMASASLLVEAPDSEPVLAFAGHPGDPQRELVAILNAYPIRRDDDPRALFECKMRLRQHALEQR